MQQFNETSKFGRGDYHLHKYSRSLGFLESFQQVQVGCWFHRKNYEVCMSTTYKISTREIIFSFIF
jgi:hypothetical protein